MGSLIPPSLSGLHIKKTRFYGVSSWELTIIGRSTYRVTFYSSAQELGDFPKMTSDEVFGELNDRSVPAAFGEQFCRKLSEEISLLDQDRWSDKALEAFNSKWRIECFKNFIRNNKAFKDLTFEEARNAVDSYFVVERVLES